MKRLLAIIFSCALAQSSHAHNVTLVKEGTADDPAIILIKGKLDLKDHLDNITELRVITTKIRQGGAIVFFDSPGGSIATAIAFGQIIRQRSFITAVADDTTCSSACALAWIAGVERYRGDVAWIGFHAPWTQSKDNADVKDISHQAVTAVARYLKYLGFDDATSAVLTSYPPSTMYWLRAVDQEKTEHGIEFKPFSLPQTEWQWAKFALEHPSSPPASAYDYGRIGTYITGTPMGTPSTWQATKELARKQIKVAD